jgi:hypothetical protein
MVKTMKVNNILRASVANALQVWLQHPAATYELQQTEECLDLEAEWRFAYNDIGCRCYDNPPCSSCSHPGNPENLQNDPLMYYLVKVK